MPKISALPSDTAPDPADLVPYVDVSASSTDQTTWTGVAASTAFTSAFVTFSGVGETVDEAVDTIWLGANVFEVTIGTATKSHYNRTNTIEMATSSGVAARIMLPSYWQTMKVMLQFTKSTANTGSVTLVTYYQAATAGDTISLPSTSATTSVAAPATGVIQENTGYANLTVNPAKAISVSLVRSATPVDTLTGDIAFLGMRLERLT